MAARKSGVHRSEAEKAQEMLDKQKNTVERLENKEEVLKKHLSDVVHQLAQERDLLDYFEKHPLLQTFQHKFNKALQEENEPELPLEYVKDEEAEEREARNVTVGGQKSSWKGFEGRFAEK